MINRSSKINVNVDSNDDIYIYPSEDESFQDNFKLQQPLDDVQSSVDNVTIPPCIKKPSMPLKSFQQSDINSLGYLTKQFIKLIIQTKPNHQLDISQAARKLNVQKRRIYDITNVLQGIGYIQKVGKNRMRWVGGTNDHLGEEINYVDQRIQHYQQEQTCLDAKINYMNHKISQLTEPSKTHPPNYLTISELIEIMKKLGTNHFVIYKGTQGVQITITQNMITGKKQAIIQAQKSKIGDLYVITRESEKGQNFMVAPVLQTIKLEQHCNQKEGKTSIRNNSVSQDDFIIKTEQQKIKIQEKPVDQSLKSNVKTQDSPNQKNKKQPLLKHLKSATKIVTQELSYKNQIIDRYTSKKKGRKSKQQGNETLVLQNEPNQIQRKQQNKQLFFQSDSQSKLQINQTKKNITQNKQTKGKKESA